jgi:hypothetical protein
LRNRGFGYYLLRQFEYGERWECGDFFDSGVEDFGEGEWADVCARGFDSVSARRCVEREFGAAFFGEFGESDYF